MAPSPTPPLSAARALNGHEQDLLQSLARLALTLPRDFAADIGPIAGVSLSEYHILMHLSEAPARKLRMGELADHTGLTLGAVTRLMRVLESKGLAERHRDANDGRVHEAHVSAAGLARLAQAAPVHTSSARRHLLDLLDPGEIALVAAALRKITGEPARHREASHG